VAICGIPTPEPVNGINVPEVASIAAGPEMAMAAGTDGTVWDWGSNSFGDLGINNATLAIEATPVNVAGLSGATQVAAGGSTSMAVHTVWVIRQF